MDTMTQNSIKVRFASYLQKRGYSIIQGTMRENTAGVSAQIKQKMPPKQAHFSKYVMVNPVTWSVLIAPKDYDNHQVTDGLL